MANLTDPRWIWFKGGLFVVTGGLASLVLIANSPRLQTIGLLAIAIWSFCRAYYFAFYVIERGAVGLVASEFIGFQTVWFVD